MIDVITVSLNLGNLKEKFCPVLLSFVNKVMKDTYYVRDLRSLCDVVDQTGFHSSTGITQETDLYWL